MKSYIDESAEECTILHGIEEAIITAKQLEDRINSCIVSENEIADDASPELNTIRRKIRNLNGKIKENLLIYDSLNALQKVFTRPYCNNAFGQIRYTRKE